jgi:RNA polymerase sigma factor (sigma-70 family)
LTEILELFDAHGRAFFGLLYRVTLREDVAEDLMQGLFLKLKVSEKFRTVTCPLAYARHTALHLAFDWRRNRTALSGAELAEDKLLDDRPSPLEHLIEVEQIQAVLDAMAGLSTRSCELLTMHYIQQQSYESLAQEHHKTPQQIRALCHKSLVQLRGLLSETSHRTGQGETP